MKMFEKLLEKKKKDGEKLDPMYKSSKMSMLKALKDEMNGMMKNDLEDGKLKKIEVASDSEEGLKAGLDKAQDVIDSVDSDAEEEEGLDAKQQMLEEIAEDAEPEDIDAMIKKLEELKAKKSMM